GHVLFNRISGGRAEDFVIVVSPSERYETGQQGFAITRSNNRLAEAVTTIGGYVMPPLMLYIGFITINYQY
ncbi:M50 family metallopeptidase, partial [Staphylococcus aureus]|uniref:M50 family metallopeptidase n=1 Tax=Staphylococcus aureus TaxID=1280 RepID=UPI00375483BA